VAESGLSTYDAKRYWIVLEREIRVVDVSSMTQWVKRFKPLREKDTNGWSTPEAAPLRAEVFSVDQLARHAMSIAASHQLASGSAADKLIPRLNDNARVLMDTYDVITAAVERNRRISPASEWLLDNFYLVEDQIRIVRRHLPPSYGRELPRLANGVAPDHPRAYAIALELISHVDGRLDADSLDAFITSYQAVTPLKIGELWALPIVLRLALIENLRRVAARLSAARKDRDSAADWADRLTGVVERNPTNLILVMADMAKADPNLSGAFLAELTRHLQGQSAYFTFATSWLEHRLSEQGQTVERLIQAEGQSQAANQVSIGNSITSLRFLNSTDWRDFVEKQSVIERTLRADPAGIYPRMDFVTRDNYRHAVEQIARRSDLSEQEVAAKANELTAMAAREKPQSRQAHVGYYLMDHGRPTLERLVQMRLSPRIVIAKIGRRFPLFFYLVSILLVTAMASAVYLTWESRHGLSLAGLCGLGALAVVAASHLAIGVVNRLATELVHPRRLPRMDFRAGIPELCRTIVVIPTMLSSLAAIDELLEGLELRYLANREKHLHFALLTDFVDAAQETMPDDEQLLDAVRVGIESLNDKYKSDRTDSFFLFHRPRKWNPPQGVWMGFERKRGKLGDLNAYLRGKRNEFNVVLGDVDKLSEVKFVITLDSDTQLPRDAAKEMVGAMAHTLNRAVIDPARGRVVDGYTILQPRVGASMTGAGRSLFVRIFGGEPGVDPYTRITSDVYQDVFDEGSFIGKGIYDIDAFEQTCSKFPENAILSHDLLEGAYGRSALLSDVELYEEFPSRYPADVSRRHRWMRGDWQIARWLLPSVPGPANAHVRNPISALSLWKIFDNLRRSVVPVAMLILLLLPWIFLPARVAAATLVFVLVVLLGNPLLGALFNVVDKAEDFPWRAHLSNWGQHVGVQLIQAICTLVFLPYDACLSLDAIARTLMRVHWTKRRLLEWRTSREVSRSVPLDAPSFYQSMWIAPALAIALGALLLLARRPLVVWEAPVLVLWLLSPLLAWWFSRTIPVQPVRLTTPQRIFLEKLARRTWRFFEVLVSPEDNFLPPDNIQEAPSPMIAPRTSPTNIGMALLADLAAHDFGYCSTGRLIERTLNTFGTLERLERYRGHFYNWYDTRSLKPLLPLYVSTVDSGNLAGHLLVLRRGLIEFPDVPVMPRRLFGGLRDTARVLLDVARGFDRNSQSSIVPVVSSDSLHKIQRFESQLDDRPESLSTSLLRLKDLAALAAQISIGIGDDEEAKWWAGALARASADHFDDLSRLLGWAALTAPHPAFWTDESPEQAKRLADLRLRWIGLESPSLRDLAASQASIIPLVDEVLAHSSQTPRVPESIRWFEQLRSAIADSSHLATERIKALDDLARQCAEFEEMDLSFLYDKSRDLFVIGYNVGDQRPDGSFYDLLASEARLASFVAIAQGQFGQQHWFALGRLLTNTGGVSALLSWSGSMFEYLMPLLVMPTYRNTLLDQTCRAVVRRQINYGRQRGVPWGISESGYNTMDLHMNYQYRAFGVPGLGLKRGLADDLVIAPYATAMALMVEPEAACKNLERLADAGNEGTYGFFEAIDYTASRLPPGADSVVVKQFMAHHEGMSLLSIAYVLLDKPMQRRFESDPMMRAADLLLQERIPKATAPVFPHAAEASVTRGSSAEAEGTMRVFTDPGGAAPEVHLLSNGSYHVVITSAGGGYSRWRDLAVTRWREDPTRDAYGTFCYLRDLETGVFWSTAWQPTCTPTKKYEAIFTQARAEFRRRDQQIETHAEFSVSPEDDIELRRITLINRSENARTIEFTSYAEVVLAQQAADQAHPAFSNLFVQTELFGQRQAIFCTRRPRSANEKPPWMVHLMTVRGSTIGEPSFETDRMKFIGRGRTLSDPLVMDGMGEAARALSNTFGPVLDPIVAIRQAVRIEPNETVRVDFVTGVAETREMVVALAEKYHDPRLADRVFELAWTHSHILLRQLNASEAEAQAYGRLAGSIVYASSMRRSKASILSRNRRGQSGLWGYGISGDLPIVLVRIHDREKIDVVRQAVQAHAYWRMKGLAVDLVIWNEDDSIYRQSLQDTIMGLIAAGPEASMVDRPGGIFVRRGEQMSEEDRVLLQTVARVVLVDEAGTLLEQVDRRGRAELQIPAFKPQRKRLEPPTAAEVPKRDVAFFNGLGGFSHDGREYVMILAAGQATPAPWCNVIANAQFGTVISESGSAYTWSENSHEFRLTPWHNDPVSDTSGEAIYLRDEESGRVWSPTPLPVRGANHYVIRHGFGYSIFEYTEDGIRTEMCVSVATDASVKFSRLKISNSSGRRRQLSVTGYWEWALGELRNKTLMHVVTQVDPASGAIFARNSYSAEFASSIVFVDCSETERTVTGDRTEFLGRNGSTANPAALRRARLSGRTGASLDPCAAIQVQVALEDGQEKEMVFILGAARDEDGARQLVRRYRDVGSAQRALEGVWNYWSRTLGVVYVETPDPAVNFLANGWLIYQVLACRMWARTGFYQSGGAFGFRDQLQDAMAIVHADPGALRQHLLRASGRQFREGDVQHWWHPPVGRGVRTHFSDDYLWLPYAVCRYVATTGDTGVLEERMPFLTARRLRPDEEAFYDQPQISDDVGTLYEHCVRSIDNGLRFGAHGLPLIGCGDWNDGMNLIGEHGKGESVWLAFFLYDVMVRFSDLARHRGDAAVADKYTVEAGRLRGNIEANSWDGNWYLRAYFDDGTPLGSSTNAECQIDALPQSWSILSGAGIRERSQTAMEHVNQRLVRREARQIQLLDPPFDKSDLNPGYIKGYLPGVRENGGQYTHAAIWTVMAFAAMGDVERAWELFSMINPVNHSSTPEEVHVYRVEPYVVAADVYAVPPHTGRGGWTWYTGSAGWMYRLITESLLGLHLEIDRLRFEPRMPKAWQSYKVHYRYRETFYHVTIHNGGNGMTVARVLVDGNEHPDQTVPLVNDRKDHTAEVYLG
jgi:cyclic beta-1,2-glucan synthetase